MFQAVLRYFLRVVAAAFMGLLVLVITVTPLRMLFADAMTPNTAAAVIGSIGSVLFLFFICQKAGYDEASAEKKRSVPKAGFPMLIAVVLYDLLTVLLRYGTAGAATGVCYIAAQLGNLGASVGIEALAEEHGGLMLVSLILQTVPFVPAMLAGYLWGAGKRRLNRAKLMGEGQSLSACKD